MDGKILHINPNEIKRNELHFNIQKKIGLLFMMIKLNMIEKN